MSKRTTTARGISFPDDLLAWLEAEAARDDRSVSYIVVKACEAWREGRMMPPPPWVPSPPRLVSSLAGDLSISDTCPRCGAALTNVDEHNNPGIIRCPECGWTLGGDTIAHTLGG